jgi:hypothetical protein
MSIFIVDVEADGPCPGPYSMVCFGAVKLTESLDVSFYGTSKPISTQWNPEALAISGFSREDHMKFEDPFRTMSNFNTWIKSNNSSGRPIFMSDNPAFDWQWINYYFHVYIGDNPFGFSARRIGDLFCGFENDFYYNWKRHRKTNHDHNPVNDAKGNAEALLYLREQGLKIPMK